MLDERADPSERLAPPIAELVDPGIDQLRGGAPRDGSLVCDLRRFLRLAGHGVCSYPPAARARRNFAAYGSANMYKPVSISRPSGSSASKPTQTACCPHSKARMLTMTAIVKAMDSQRWNCRSHVFQLK